MVRKRYDEELERVSEELRQMGLACEKAIAEAFRYVNSGDETLPEEIQQLEMLIDEQEKRIEEACLRLFIREQPVASDLRHISATIKMISDLERIGDHAVDIAEVGQDIDRENQKLMEEISRMATAAGWMVNSVVEGYIHRDLQIAADVIKFDDVVDELFASIKGDIAKSIAEGSEQADSGLDFLMVAKYLERIGDHAVNVAEWINFSQTGHKK